MPTDVLLLVATAVLAVVAVVAAVVAVRAARQLDQAPPITPSSPERLPRTAVVVPLEGDRRLGEQRLGELEPRHVGGRVVVPPTGQQVANTALGRPQVRVSILIHGLAHALRPESRDRIAALMRREYRRRRRERLRAGRRAIRAAQPVSADDWTEQPWIAELPEARHDRTGHDKTGHDKTGHDRTGHDRTGHDRTGEVRS